MRPGERAGEHEDPQNVIERMSYMGLSGILAHIQTLLTTAGTGVTALGVPGGGLMVGYHALMRSLNDDPQSVAHHTSSIRKVLVGTAMIAGSGVLVAVAGKLI